MTNIYDVLSKMHIKATGNVEKAVKKELDVEDPPKEEAKAILEEAIEENTDDENPERHDTGRSSGDNQ